MATTTQKTLTWLFAAVSSLASYIAIQSRASLTESRELREQDKAYYQKQIEVRDLMITKERHEKDSLQGVIVSRSDNSYQELKSLFKIDSTKKSTIIIKTLKK
ncbi:hypothetical protein [Pedobacter punctiformis]|uniref:Uncharacterized protein n=1 Tax=Pedobacter punctiformis TaxID=3004097 RepID=A0ABT4LAR1_9SPHI|nr:hypothetical protein [Pedobacter sp. HCMS5-2]MCZ4244988.1 hypothetical protein [Pedobacter sp. HCMS5-2]